MTKIAVIDDDVSIGNLIQEVLEKEGYRVVRAYSGSEALLLLSRERVDLVLLDLMLPGVCGEEVLEKIKELPVIVVSAKTDVDDKVRLLLRGAADYVPKPFDIAELSARVRVQLRKRVSLDGTLRWEDIELEPNRFRAAVSGTDVKLTRTEFAILKALLQNSDRVVTRSALMETIELDAPDAEESSLKTHIANLRAKLKGIGSRDYIEAVWGIGYKLKS